MSSPVQPSSESINGRRVVVISAIGFATSVGFALAGMTNPGSIMNFMDLKKIPQVGAWMHSNLHLSLPSLATWDPSVLIVFCTALGLQLPLYHLFIKNRTTSWIGGNLCIPKHTHIDLRLLGGAAAFGAGWAFTGFCPGPALASAFAGAPNAVIYLASVLVGKLGVQWYDAKLDVKGWFKTGKHNGLVGSLLGLGGLLSGAILMRVFNPLVGTKSSTGPLNPLPFTIAGGALIALAGTIYTLSLGKVMGLSGMLSQSLSPTTAAHDRWDRLIYLTGLAIGAIATRWFNPSAFFSSAAAPALWKIIFGGLLVGVGTGCSNGCTSGHGLAGISRLSIRSIAATVAFFGTNVLVSTFLL